MSRLMNVRVFVLLAALLGGSLAGGSLSPAVAQSRCSFKGKLKINPESIMLESDPVLGNPSADVLLVEFFDPNCTPCQRFDPIMEKVMEKYGDRIQFYMHPIPASQYSVRQIAAMLLAKEKGKYYEMIDLQLENPQKRGMGIK
ncbi:MAG: DsbA family protein, partial [Salinibacter sp.]